MKISAVFDSVSRSNGGIFEAERRLLQTLACEQQLQTRVLGLRDEFSDADKALWQPLVPEAMETVGPRSLGFSPALAAALEESNPDVVYRAGLWTGVSRSVLKWSKRHRKPLIIAPHGMLDPWAIKRSAWKKRLASMFYESAHLRAATCLRALCEAEVQAIRQYGLKNPVCIIPNGVDLPELNGAQANVSQSPPAGALCADRKVLLYLGRIHSKKGLANLIEGWAQMQKETAGKSLMQEWILAIAGWDDGGHEKSLKSLADRLKLRWADPGSSKFNARPALSSLDPGLSTLDESHSLVFLGPQFGAAKIACYRRCDAFVLPSLSEGLPMAVLEAWSYAKPVLMTPECNLPEGFARGAALQIRAERKSIAQGLRELTEAATTNLRSMGAAGRDLVQNRFSWSAISSEMRGVFEWVAGEGPRPGSVVLS
ncbi:MAG: glycosyl transferase family 1 [Verrucomicrobia bacterium]|nr:MAG: glycosyl transferase family 1 [Verrucomicrobiota bacterium]